MGFGRNGDLVANTPRRLFPSRPGGLTVAWKDLSGATLEKPHRSQIWEYALSPLSASGFLYSGRKLIVPFRDSTRPLCLGIPNFSEKSVCIKAMGSMFNSILIRDHSAALIALREFTGVTVLHYKEFIVGIALQLLSHIDLGPLIPQLQYIALRARF